jgi:Ca-activated chloride channel homolog
MSPTPPALRARISTAALLIAAGVLTACSDSSGPNLPPIQSLAVSGVQLNSATFASNGRFGLGLLATSDGGDAILNTAVSVSAQVTAISVGNPSASTVARVGTESTNPQSGATQATILMDNSGSMSGTDPQRLRAAAAKLFWEAVLPVRATNRVAFLDFGSTPTTGFASTRLLVPFTTSALRLDSALTRVQASGGTPLYESLRETARWIDTSTTGTTDNRVMLLLSDGQPNSRTNRDSAIAIAARAKITVHTVGLGPASDLATSGRDTVAIGAIREIADRTGGVYAAATDASALGPIFTNIARASSRGQLVTTFAISPIPASGTRVSGTVTVSSGGTTQTANWTFVAP